MIRAKTTQRLTAIPTALAGLALAIASLGWSWENVFAFQGKAQISGAIIASLLLSLLTLKFIVNPLLLKQEIAHYMRGSMVPTFAMTTMVIASSVNYFNHCIATALWVTAIVFHLFFLLLFIYYQLQEFKFKCLLPSWFIPPIGLALAAITLPEGGSERLFSMADLLLQLGFVAYALLLPVTLYRCFIYAPLCEAEKPTLAIFATPASLLLVAYLVLVEVPNYRFVILLSLLALVMTLFVYFYFKQLLRLPFTPAYSAFTFPLVMGATAMFKLSQFLLVSGSATWVVNGVLYLAYVELIIATAMVLYVCYRYVHFFKLSNK